MATLPVRAGVAFQRPALPQLRGTASVSARRLAGAASHATASARGGLTPKMIFLRGKALQAMYKPCYLDAQASANRPAATSR